jgi:hypothetical protein
MHKLARSRVLSLSCSRFSSALFLTNINALREWMRAYCSRACILPFIGWVWVRANIQWPEGTPRHVGAGPDQGQEQQQYERNDDARNPGLCVWHGL